MRENDIVPIAVFAEGTIKTSAIPLNMVMELTKKLREKGETYLFMNDRSNQKIEGFVVIGKGQKGYSLMLIPEEE